MNINTVKPQTNLITEKQLDALKKGGAQVFTPTAVDKFRLQVLVAAKEATTKKEKEQLLKKAEADLKGLYSVEVLKDNGDVEKIMVKLSKGLKFKTPQQEKDGEDGNEANDSEGDANDSDNNSDKNEKPEEKEESNEKSEGEEKEESEESESSEEEQSEGKEGEEKEESSEPSEDEEKEVLSLIAESLGKGNDVTSEELEEGSSYPDDQTKKILTSLKSKNLIELNIDDNGNMDVIAITDEGKALIGGGDSNPSNENGNENGNEEGNENGNNNENGNENNADENGNENNGGEQNDTENEEQNNTGGADNKADVEYTPEELAAHAKSTPDDKLKEFVSNPNTDPQMKQVAQQELDSRASGQNGEGQEGEQKGEVTDENGQQQNPEDQAAAENAEFAKWLDSHFSEHDEEDLAKIVKDLIGQAPGKRKELKEKFKADFAKNNNGNSMAKVDDKEFGEWLDQYLAHLPFNDLKDYANKLVAKNPDAFTQMKKKYSSFKENGMLDS